MHTGEVKTPGGRGGRRRGRRALGQPARPRLRAPTVQDRHAAPAQRPDDRLLPARAPARRRRAGPVLVPDRPDRRSRSSTATSPTTNPAVHDLIRANLHRAPMYSGQIQSTGPRYCPSIEDKVVRFADREQHQIFLEPEGRNTLEYYCNGISTSLPRDVQEAIIPLIPGLEHAEIMRFGYAVEYDFAPPTQLRADARDQAGPRPLLRRPDQRHDRLRGGRRPGADRRDQRRAGRRGATSRSSSTARRRTSAS